MSQQSQDEGRTSRRRMLEETTGVLALGAAALGGVAHAGDSPMSEVGTVIKNGRIKQSLVHWCYAPYWGVEQMIQVAKQLGCGSIELIEPQVLPPAEAAWPGVRHRDDRHEPRPAVRPGLQQPQVSRPGDQGYPRCIDACAEYGYKHVITFTGMAEGIPDDVGAKNCVEGYKKIIGHAEKKGVTLCLEMLNTRETAHPMKGHPGYQGDHTDYCVDIINRVGSPNLKLLFDIYHVQIMDGDLIRRIHQLKDVIGHVHTAGNPGRGELDEKQEIAYKPVMEALLDIGYQGYVGQEFIPTRDPLAGLRQAVALCDV